MRHPIQAGLYTQVGRHVIWLALLALLQGCATLGAGPPLGGGGPRGVVAAAVMGGVVRVDDFEQVLLNAGVDNVQVLPAREAPFTPEDAAALYEMLLDKPVTLAGFGPRLVASSLLREVMEGEEELPRAVLLQRVERYSGLAVLRPDGYLAWALDGQTQQRVGHVEWKDGAFRVGAFEVGSFYSGRNHMAFFAVDEQLREMQPSPVLAEVHDDADVISRTLDGAEESFAELALAIGKLVVHPVDSVAELSQLPVVLATLIKNSPEYLERFRLMTRGEQIKALSKLSTTLLSTYGAAGGTTRSVIAAGRGLEAVSVPVLTLTAEGTLAVGRVAVPAGRAVMALGAVLEPPSSFSEPTTRPGEGGPGLHKGLGSGARPTRR